MVDVYDDYDEGDDGQYDNVFYIDGEQDMEVYSLINGEPEACLIDTGSKINLINAELLTKLQQQDPQIHMQPTKIHIQGISSQKVLVEGLVSIVLSIGKHEHELEFLVIQHNRRLILGTKYIVSSVV